MHGLIIWAQSSCRSTMGLYAEVRKQLDVPVLIALWHYQDSCCDIRAAVGHDKDEFAGLPTINVGEDLFRGMEVLDSHPGYTHIFAVYQSSRVWRELAIEAKRRGERVIIASEAPCNMSSGIRHILKEVYMRYVLPHKVKDVVRCADLFLNFSGNDDKYAKLIGWSEDKIVPFGYFPPPVKNSHLRIRTTNRPFTILATGILSRYRGADILVEALRILSARGVAYKATITQNGELHDALKRKANKYSLPIEFPGFIAMDSLIHLYETCSVYVGAGRHEPWGMRLNDALNCGAPLVVSTGMGGAKLVRDHGCGLCFENKSPNALADALQSLASDEELYVSCAKNVSSAVNALAPQTKASELISLLKKRILG